VIASPGTLISIIGLVVFGNSTAGQSVATSLLARPWNVIGALLLLPPSAGLSSARSVIYLGGVNLTGHLTVLCCYALAGTPLAYRWLRGVPPDDDTISRLAGLAIQGLQPREGA
jgi:hypothetical protein